jgi:hypothetical protein
MNISRTNLGWKVDQRVSRIDEILTKYLGEGDIHPAADPTSKHHKEGYRPKEAHGVEKHNASILSLRNKGYEKHTKQEKHGHTTMINRKDKMRTAHVNHRTGEVQHEKVD